MISLLMSFSIYSIVTVVILTTFYEIFNEHGEIYTLRSQTKGVNIISNKINHLKIKSKQNHTTKKLNTFRTRISESMESIF